MRRVATLGSLLNGNKARVGRSARWFWRGKKWEDMDDDELDLYEKRWWRKPVAFLAVFLTYVWIPENEKFYWHLRLQMWVHEQYWRFMLPADQAESLIAEARIGIPSRERTVQNPLAACPLTDEERAREDPFVTPPDLIRDGPLPEGHPGFASAVIQAAHDITNVPPKKAPVDKSV